MNRRQRVTVQQRRRWLASILRQGVLAGLAFLVWGLVGRSLRHGCPTWSSSCQKCALLVRCELPAARSAKSQSHKEKRL